MDAVISSVEVQDQEYFPLIDCLRAISCFLVIVAHSALNCVEVGYWGVYLFFAISGFLISRILISGATEKNFIANFYARRWTKIVPPYYVSLLAYLIMVSLPIQQRDHNFAALWGDLPAYLTFTAGFFKPVVGPFGLAWSLAVEELFYLFAPLCFFVLRSRLALQLFLVVLLGLSYIILPLFFNARVCDRVFHCLPPSLVCGCFVGLLSDDENLFAKITKMLVLLATCIGAALVSQHYLGSFAFGPMAGIILAGIVLMSAHFRGEFAFFKPLSNLGRLSYEFYLVHIPFTAISSRLAAAISLPWIAPVVASCMVILVGRGFYRLVSRPALNLRRKLAENEKLTNVIAILQVIPIPVGTAFHFLTLR